MNGKWFLLLFAIFAIVWIARGQELFKYKQLRFDIDDPAEDIDIYNAIPTGLAHHGDRLFVAVARRRLGVPSTLNYIDLTEAEGKRDLSPILYPFPDSTVNALHRDRKSDENRIISVYRPRVDVCDRLWFVDTGVQETPNKFIVYQRPAIWVIDLNRDLTLQRYQIPSALAAHGHGLASITIDVDPESCDDAFAYIPDSYGNGLIVYDYKENRAWRFTTNYFYMNPLQGDYKVKNVEYQSNAGIVSVALGNRDKLTGFRSAYFHAASSYSEFRVSTKVLRNESEIRMPSHWNNFKLFAMRPKRSNVGMHAFHPPTNVMFNSELQRHRITCTNFAAPFKINNTGIVFQDEMKLIYPADLSIDLEDNLWFLSNALPLHTYSVLNVAEDNYYIWRMSIASAIKNTVCEYNP